MMVVVHIIVELGASKVFGRSGTHVIGVLVGSERYLATVEVHTVFGLAGLDETKGYLLQSA